MDRYNYKKKKDNKPQSELNKLERIKNVEDIYEINKPIEVKNKKVLFIRRHIYNRKYG